MPIRARPVVFIGSSSEGLSVAQALQLNLDRYAEVILWSQGVFGLSEGSLESLVARLQDFDFAVLVLSPDDLTVSRVNQTQSPRDNVVFELGLFMGALGRTRSFIVYDRTADIKIPSDLAGVIPATYQPPSTGSLQAAVGACSTAILSAIQTNGIRDRSTLKLHGFSGEWALTTQFIRWRQLSLTNKDQVVFNGTMLLFLPATGRGGHGCVRGDLDVRIGNCRARFRIIDEIRDASVDCSGALRYITKMTSRHRMELIGEPPQADGFEPELHGIVEGEEVLQPKGDGTMEGQGRYTSLGENYTEAITKIRRATT